MKKTLAFLISLFFLCGCGSSATEAGTDSQSVSAPISDGGGFITLADSGSSFTGSGISLSGNTVTITAGGEYTVTGSLSDGQLIIAAPKSAKVELTIDNADICCSTGAALYVETADKLVVTLAGDSKNAIRSTGSFVQTDDTNVDAALFSREDLTIKGSGSLEVSCEAGHGIVGKDDLKISGGDISITADRKGISSNDSLTVKGGSINVVSGDDAMNCDGDISISGGELTLSSGDDGIHSDAALSVSSGNINIIKSYEGLEGLSVNISGGDISVVSSDDGINAAGEKDSDDPGVPDDTGFFPGSSDSFFQRGEHPDNDDGQHFGRPSDNGMPLPPDGKLQVPNGGMPQPGGEAPMTDINSDAVISISGGSLTIRADGDGIDSNGALYVTGGSVYISGPTNDGNSALDYTTTGSITDGIFIASGSSGMAMNFDSSSIQCSILYNFPQRISAGAEVSLVSSDGTVIARYSPKKDFNSILISVPELKTGESYILTADGTPAEISMDSTLYNSRSTGGFGPGGMEPPGGFGKRK